MLEQTNNQQDPTVISVNISKGGIPKLPVDSCLVTEQGLQKDGHDHEKHYRLEQAVCLQDIEKLEEINSEGYELKAGTTGENLTVRNLNVNNLPIGTVLKFPSGLKIELTKVRVSCYVLDAIDPKLKDDITGRCGMYAKVVNEGILKTNDRIEVIQAPQSV